MAASPGTWGRNLVASVDHDTKDQDLPVAEQDDNLFNLTLLDDPDTKADADARGGSGATETFRNVSIDPASPRFVTSVLAHSRRWSASTWWAQRGRRRPRAAAAAATSGNDGIDLVDADVVGKSDDKPACTR